MNEAVGVALMYVSNTLMLFSLCSLHVKSLVKTKQNVYMMNGKKRAKAGKLGFFKA